MAAQLKPDALAMLKKVVAAAEGTAPSAGGTAGGDMVAPKKSKKGAHRAKKCKNGWGAGPRNGSFKPRTLAVCHLENRIGNHGNLVSIQFEQIWTDVIYHILLSPCIDLSFSIVVRRG